MKIHADGNGGTIHYGGEGDPILVLGDDAGSADFGLLTDWFELVAPDPAALAGRCDPADTPELAELADQKDLADLGAEAAAVAALIEELDLWPVRVLAWGEAVPTALRLAVERPDLVGRLAVIGPLPPCDGLPCRTRLTALATLATPLLILQGDDEALDIAHSAAVARTVPDGRLAVLPRPSHRLPTAQPDLVGLILLEFFEESPALRHSAVEPAAPGFRR
jgi:pimeloyl-ACP methyl ester carboxylesterase